MLKVYCFILFGILNAGGGYTHGEIATLVKEYVSKVLSKDRGPTLVDFRYYNGKWSESEWDFLVFYCILRGWIQENPADMKIDPWAYPMCADYEYKSRKLSNKVPSLYYAWLRKKLPLSPKLKIINIEHVYHGDYYLVKAKLNKTNVLFYVPPREEAVGDGKVSISEIEGRYLRDILKEDDIPNFKKGSLDFLLEAGDLSKYESEKDKAPAAR